MVGVATVAIDEPYLPTVLNVGGKAKIAFGLGEGDAFVCKCTDAVGTVFVFVGGALVAIGQLGNAVDYFVAGKCSIHKGKKIIEASGIEGIVAQLEGMVKLLRKADIAYFDIDLATVVYHGLQLCYARLVGAAIVIDAQTFGATVIVGKMCRWKQIGKVPIETRLFGKVVALQLGKLYAVTDIELEFFALQSVANTHAMAKIGIVEMIGKAING